jgi:predicted lysophospholipase L1 biosynthesis ABC-type transport system permease subunit
MRRQRLRSCRSSAPNNVTIEILWDEVSGFACCSVRQALIDPQARFPKTTKRIRKRGVHEVGTAIFTVSA